MSNWENAILHLWSVIEYLTYTGTKNYDVTIERASFIFDDRELAKQILNQLREYRNNYVHKSEISIHQEMLMYQAKYYCEQQLLFHIFNSFHFETLEEASKFLDLSKDKSKLSRNIKLFDYALKNYAK